MTDCLSSGFYKRWRRWRESENRKNREFFTEGSEGSEGESSKLRMRPWLAKSGSDSFQGSCFIQIHFAINAKTETIFVVMARKELANSIRAFEKSNLN